jgi:transcriptional regulator with XRE-family HTH domain
MATQVTPPRGGKKKKPELPSLALWRERMGYSQAHACEALGCSKQAWIGWEHGRMRTPRYIYLAMAALALGMKPYGEPNGED